MKWFRDKIQKLKEGGSIFAGQSSFDIAIQQENQRKDNYIDQVNKTIIEPNSGAKGIFKSATGILSTLQKQGTAAAGAMTGDIGAASGAVGGNMDIINAAAAPFLAAKQGRDMISDYEKQTAENIDAIKTQRSKSIAAAIVNNMGYAEGGVISGPGTAKSDSINATGNSGDVVIPAENADKALTIGQEYLGWDSNQRASMNGSKPVKVSNGEVYFTKAEANRLKYLGIDVYSLIK